LCREQYLSDELKVVYSWTNPAKEGRPGATAAGRVDIAKEDRRVTWNANGTSSDLNRRPSSSIELDRAAERIELWLLEWLVGRLGLDVADVSRDKPFAEFGVDSLTAVELSHELEVEFKVPLPPIVAWNYPTPAALARYLAEQSLAPKPTTATSATSSSSSVSARSSEQSDYLASGPQQIADSADDQRLAALLAEVENLSDAEAARLLADEQRR
jgi:acyl carrier protein